MEISATVDRNPVVAGQRFGLTIEVKGSQDVAAPSLDNLGPFQAQYLGPTTRMSSVNGRVSSSISHRYSLVTDEVGEFKLGPFRVTVGGEAYQTNSVSLQVLARSKRASGASSAAGAGGELRLSVEPAKKILYVGERVSLVIKLWVGDVRVDDLQYPELEAEGFVIGDMPQPSQRDEVRNGRRYRVVEFAASLTALRTGRLPLGPVTMGLSVVENRRRGGDPFLGGFFGFSRRRPVELRAEPISLEVRPLPLAGRPATFSGAIGRFDFTLSAAPTELSAGDPITVRSEIRGVGNLSTLSPPRVPVGEGFRAYDPIVIEAESAPGRYVSEQVIIPRDPTITELPALSFGFFDPDAGSYRVITRGPIPLSVSAVPSDQRPQVLSAEPAAEPERALEDLGRDIVYIKDEPGGLLPRRGGLDGLAWFVVAALLPLCSFTALAFWLRRRDRLAADPRVRRFRRVGRETRRALAELARSGDPGDRAFYDRLTSVVNGYLCAKLDLPPGAVERQRVIERLSESAVPGELRGEIESLFDLLEAARYAPGSTAVDGHRAALEIAGRVVLRLERERGLAQRLGMAAVLLLLSAALALAAPVYADTAMTDLVGDPHTAFFQANTAYKEGRYRKAIDRYQDIADAGIKSGPLYFNLGNAYFKLGRCGHAILNYVRAERLIPRDPDLRANLAYAREFCGGEDHEEWWWQRLASSLARRATSFELAVVASVLWWMMWIVLAARLLLPGQRSLLARAATALALVFVVVASSLVYRLASFDLASLAVVTPAEGGSARYEPAQNGTEYFELKQGALVEITRERDGWLQIRRSDGRRGWVPEGLLGRV